MTIAGIWLALKDYVTPDEDAAACCVLHLRSCLLSPTRQHLREEASLGTAEDVGPFPSSVLAKVECTVVPSQVPGLPSTRLTCF